MALRSAMRFSIGHFGPGGSPRIYSGEERFSAPERAPPSTMRFSAGPLKQLRDFIESRIEREDYN
jgi:hypothetical protein